jgi:hypothetical protein
MDERRESLLAAVVAWAGTAQDIAAVALVGSHARGASRRDSDVDILLVANDVKARTAETEWLRTFGEVGSYAREEWGAVTSVRVQYDEGLEVEFGLTTPHWAATDPVDEGTARVVRGGFRILLDAQGLLGRLEREVALTAVKKRRQQGDD